MEKKSRIFPFTTGVEDWQALLADPDRHWRKGYSARTLAYCWESSEELPEEVAQPFAESMDPLLANLQPVIGIPEFKVPLPGGRNSSQNDIFILSRSTAGPVCIMVEGKVSESFGPRVTDWLKNASEGKMKRLEFLLDSLGLTSLPDDTIRYQLLHRAVSAIITAEQFRAVAAVMLIHSFSRELVGWLDYSRFASLFEVEAVVGSLQKLSVSSKVPLFGVWVIGNHAFLEC
ncbi:hypothetical protein Despr_2666 [Desulfobulbus propionicus DSM 2032]|jgi:hypothetical protein|uniref:DUF6946 domain-containing protein n=1 Tax=Desulfobulbus propionicus (strain ATCC 33891 / DSM 2032 / VKM B-1956 / 1pr3) TaxID=577650 RepID=A0A7U4DQ68_DESPD|nr:hypothetical protein [Desulfobulbus propionicus]ADW18802.1 hypothetical protein Despr_2666 [Desulfobulbus propionicus DSM 2032]